MKKQILILVSFMLIAGAAVGEPETYDIDDTHSFANFTIRHVASKTSGTFSDIDGVIKIDRDNLANASVVATIQVASINTSHVKRDKHIKKPEYLDAVNFKEITFVSKRIKAISATEGLMTGDFTMHGVTKEITMPFKVLGFGMDPWGGTRSGFEAHTTIKASDFGFGWMKKANSALGDDIAVTLLIEGKKAKEKIGVFKDN
jgi:polyisoprenoid-binding protein YceI